MYKECDGCKYWKSLACGTYSGNNGTMGCHHAGDGRATEGGAGPVLVLDGAAQRRKGTVPGEAVRRTSGMADYWHKAWSCPFYAWSDRQRVMCEGGVAIKFPDVKAAVEYMDAYCACGENGWRKCTIAACLLEYYDRKE